MTSVGTGRDLFGVAMVCPSDQGILMFYEYVKTSDHAGLLYGFCPKCQRAKIRLDDPRCTPLYHEIAALRHTCDQLEHVITSTRNSFE